MSMKILSPAGNMDSLKMAVFNGADEVYLGVKEFNARNNIEGFSLSTLKDAVDFAHIFGVKINLAVNILFRDDEIQNAVDLVIDAYNIGVDCFIIQDWGLINILHQNYPQIEIHASTQMGIHNLEGVKAVENLGVKRVVLARETELEEIKRIKQNSDVEIEYFAHGALCVCFSGNCYLSSYTCDASGNRGKCKQLCRLPYELYFGDKKLKSGYLLSAKDFNMIDTLEDLKQAGVDVLKIEGRARRPFYVATSTKAYRDKLDGKSVDEQELNLAFNRGFTAGYFDGNGQIISKIQGHNGIQIGVVSDVKAGKKFNEIYIETDYDIAPKSSLKFFNNSEEVCSISPYDIKREGRKTKITTTADINIGATVNLLSDNFKEETIIKQTKKLPIDIKIFAEAEENIKAVVSVNNNQIEIVGDVLSKAKSSPLTIDELCLNFAKSDLFEANITAKLGQVFIPKSKLNEFRRNVFEKIKQELCKISRKPAKKIELNTTNDIVAFGDFVITDKFVETDKNNIILDLYSFDNIDEIIGKFANKKIYLNLPNFARAEDIAMLKNIVKKYKLGVVVNNAYALDFECDKVAGGGLNVYNSFSAKYYNMPIILAEGCNLNAEIISMPYMTLRHCPMKNHLQANCAKCPYKDGYTYKMPNGKVLKLKRKKMSTCSFYLTD
ncbi:MAG: U32 family peptidase [Clostridia bacterium]|nr:U32 family peptidase [Clostridia bacterium]